MPQQFIAQLENICRRRRRRDWLTATCWAVALVLVAALALVGIDRALGIADPAGRGLSTIVFVVLSTLIIRRWYQEVSSSAVTPLEVAHEVEQRHPALRDVVANAWEFSRPVDNDHTAGSESLRRAVVLHAATTVDEVDWQKLIPRKPLQQAAFALAGVGLTLGMLGWWVPQTMGIGLTRLVNPLSTVEWPREHDLQFAEPPKLLAAGEDLILQLHDTHGPLPSTITMHYRARHQGGWHEENQAIGATGNTIEILRTNVHESLQYRATGADHQTMLWQSLEVIPAPRIEQLQVTVHPPDYTGLAARPWDKGAVMYTGSELELQGRTDQPVTQVVLTRAGGGQLVAAVGSEGKSFRIERSDWRVESSGTCTLQLTTAEGLTSRAATELTLDVIDDQPPQVRFIEPLGDLSVLPHVAVPMVIEASDELAVREMELVYRRSDRPSEGEQRLPLWSATNKQAIGPTEEDKLQHRIEYHLQLEPLSLEPGSVVELYARASDYQPAMGQTVRAIRLSIVSEEELWHQILEQQARLVETLAQLLREQHELRSITAEWAESPEWSRTRWASASHAALFRQRQIAHALIGSQSSMLEQLGSLVQTIERNRLLRPEAVERFQVAQEQLQYLADHPLVAAERSLEEIARHAQRSPAQEQLQSFIATTAEHQDQTLAGLHRVIELLMPGNVLGRLEREMAAIETDQKDLAKHCREEIAPLVFESKEANPDQRDVFAIAVRRQRELARILAELVLDMTQVSERLVDNETVLSARLAETVALAEELGTQATIQAAADQLARQRLGRSATMQRRTLEDLAKLRLRLSGQDAKTVAERFKGLQASERELQRLRRKVAALERGLRKLSPEERQRELERLSRQRQKLAAQAETIARQLERLRIPIAAQATNDAATRLRRAPLDSETTKQARQHLDLAQRQLTAARRRQQVALARLEMARLDAKLSAFVARQQAIQQEIFRLEGVLNVPDQLSKAQQQSVRQLAKRQVDLLEEVIVQADLLTMLPVFAHLLRVAGETMQTVEERLQQLKLNQPTSSLAEQAVRHLTQLASAVRQERKSLSASKQSQGRGGQGNNNDTAQSQTLQLALGQLQLLKSLQAALQEKTQTLESQQSADQPLSLSASELARQQQQLTELARQLVPEPPDSQPEKLFPNFEQELERSLEEIKLP